MPSPTITPRPAAASPGGLHVLYQAGSIVTVEAPPHPVTFSVVDQLFHCELPWMVYTLEVRESGKSKWGNARVCSAFGRPARVVDAENHLYYLPLPNFYQGSLTFCTNSCFYPLSLSDEHRLMAILAGFWSTFSYIQPDGPYEAVWERARELATQSVPGHRDPIAAAGGHSHLETWAYAAWETLTADEVLAFPFGMVSTGTLAAHITSQSYGYGGYYND